MSELETIEIIGDINLEEKELSKEPKKLSPFFLIMLLIGIGLILLSFSLGFYYEYYTPSQFCKSVGAEHSVKFFVVGSTHFCNGAEIELYSNGWRYPLPEINFNP